MTITRWFVFASAFVAILLLFVSAQSPDGQSRQLYAAGACAAIVALTVTSQVYSSLQAKLYELNMQRLRSGVENLLHRSIPTNPPEKTASEMSGPLKNTSSQIIDATLASFTEALNEGKRKERSVLEHAVDVICSIGTDHRFLSVNAAARKVWGYEPDELIGTEFTKFLVEDELERTLETLIGVEKSADKLSFENKFKRKDGKIIDLLWSAHWSAADGALFCVAHDICARKSAERQLQESEARIREILDHMPVGLLIVNSNGLIELGNPALVRSCQYPLDELAGMPVQQILPYMEKDLGTTDLASLLKKKEVVLKASNLLCKSGENLAVDISLSRTAIQGKPRFLLVLLDISEREEIENSKRRFVAMVSHELRAPLTSVQVSMALIGKHANAQATEKLLNVVERCQNEIARLIRLTNDLLDIEKARAGKFDLHIEPSKVSEIILASIRAVEYLAEKRRVKIVYEQSATICLADGARLIQVMVNLLSNAVKFSPPESKIHVSAKYNNGEVLFSVQDEGRGIPERFRESIFQAFEQVSRKDDQALGGTGLGLPICKSIIEQHAGKIWVDSDPAKTGSTFCFTIPAVALSKE